MALFLLPTLKWVNECRKKWGVIVLRIGVIAYLMLVTAAGPAYCCCTSSEFVAACGDEIGALFSSANSKPSQRCCNRHKYGGHRTKPQGNVPARNGECPCQEHQPAVAYLAAVENMSNACRASLSDTNPDTLYASVCDVKAFTAAVRAPRTCTAFPFLHTGDILSLLQILRC